MNQHTCITTQQTTDGRILPGCPTCREPSTGLAQMKARWKADVFKRQLEIDPDLKHNWHDMAFGFFLTHGLSQAEALSVADDLDDEGLL